MGLKEVISRNLKTLRKELRLSQAAVAKRAGLTIRFISGFENSPSNISVDTVEQIAKGLGVSSSRLVRPPSDALVVPAKAAEDVKKAIELLQRHLETIQS